MQSSLVSSSARPAHLQLPPIVPFWFSTRRPYLAVKSGSLC